MRAFITFSSGRKEYLLTFRISWFFGIRDVEANTCSPGSIYAVPIGTKVAATPQLAVRVKNGLGFWLFKRKGRRSKIVKLGERLMLESRPYQQFPDKLKHRS